MLSSHHPRSSHRSWEEEDRDVDLGWGGSPEGLPIGWVRRVGKIVVEGDRIQEPNGGGRKDVDSLRQLLVLSTQGLCGDGD